MAHTGRPRGASLSLVAVVVGAALATFASAAIPSLVLPHTTPVDDVLAALQSISVNDSICKHVLRRTYFEPHRTVVALASYVCRFCFFSCFGCLFTAREL